MSEQNESLVRSACEAYSRADIATMLEYIDPALQWTYLDPGLADPEPRTCHGREQLRLRLRDWPGRGLCPNIEEIAGSGDKVMVVIHTPGLDRQRVRQGDDRNFLVLTLRQRRIVAIRACRDRVQAREFAGLA